MANLCRRISLCVAARCMAMRHGRRTTSAASALHAQRRYQQTVTGMAGLQHLPGEMIALQSPGVIMDFVNPVGYGRQAPSRW